MQDKFTQSFPKVAATGLKMEQTYTVSLCLSDLSETQEGPRFGNKNRIVEKVSFWTCPIKT